MTTCRYIEGQGRMTTRHDRYCNTSGCEGCEPCRDDHCGMANCDRHLTEHEPLVCGRCVGKVRENIKRVVQLCTLTPVAAAETGRINTLAEVIAGPVPERSTYRARHEYVTSGASCRCDHRQEVCPDLQPIEGPTCHESPTCKHTTCQRLDGMRVCPDFLAWTELADDELHPLWVLGSWDMAVAEHLGHNRTLRVTIASAASYLDAHLTDLARDTEFAFDELAREIRDTLRHVEDSLALTLRPTKGAPCPACRAAGRPAKALRRTFKEGVDDSKDQWVCPTKACAKTYELGDYDEMVYKDYLDNATQLTAAQILAQYRIPEGTLRRWANGYEDRLGRWHDATVRKCGYDGQRRQLYDTADVRRMRDSDAA